MAKMYVKVSTLRVAIEEAVALVAPADAAALRARLEQVFLTAQALSDADDDVLRSAENAARRQLP